MLSVLRTLVICVLAGILLAIFFLTPEGAIIGALNGLLVGICVALAERRAQRSQPAVANAIPIRLIGSYADSIA